MIFLLEFSLVVFFSYNLLYRDKFDLFGCYLAKNMVFNNLKSKKECFDMKYFSYLCDRKKTKKLL